MHGDGADGYQQDDGRHSGEGLWPTAGTGNRERQDYRQRQQSQK
jgi:hypothetical protein